MDRKESAAERIARMRREKEAATATDNTDLVGQLTHQSAGEPDLAALAEKLGQRKDKEKVSVTETAVKYTIYIDKPVATAFDALCINRGDQRRYATEALRDFVLKKSRELGL